MGAASGRGVSDDPRSPPPTLRESQISIGRGPLYAGMARDLARTLYACRLTGTTPDYRIAAGALARECDAMAESFDLWSAAPPGPERVRTDVIEFQDIKARARRLGLEVL